jgi:hypothetical protein
MRGYNARWSALSAGGTRHEYTSIAGDATVTGAGNRDVSALPCLETQPPSGLHRAAGEPRHRHSRESKVRSLGSSASVDRSDLLRFAVVTRWAVGQA